MKRILEILPPSLFALACLSVAFGVGLARGAAHRFPHLQYEAAKKTLDSALHYYRAEYSVDFLGREAVPAQQVSKRRLVAHTSGRPDQRYLVLGGPQRFLELCPGNGCLAVVLQRSGKVVAAYPFRPAEFLHGDRADLPSERLFMRPELDVTPVGAIPLPGGDIIVTFHFDEAFPYGGGIARVKPSGKVAWYRHDYSNHWASLIGDNELAVISGKISKVVEKIYLGPYHRFTVGCPEGYTRDSIEIIDLDGNLKQEIPIFDALLASPLRNHFMSAVPAFEDRGTCDPMHANFVRAVGPEIAAGFTDVAATDLLVSMRNLSTLGIVSRASGKFTHLLRGTFHFQHSAQPIAGGKILMVDNLGATSNAEATRYLIFDPATGHEQTLFPRENTPKGTPTLTPAAGNIAVSSDGQTALIAVTYAGKGYEVDLHTGELLTTFENLHDLRTTGLEVPAKRNQAARFKLWGIYPL